MEENPKQHSSLAGRESLVLEQCLRSIFNLGLVCRMNGRVYKLNGEEVSSISMSKSTQSLLAVKRTLPASLLSNIIEKVKNTKKVVLVDEPDNTNTCVCCSIFIHDVFVAVGVIYDCDLNAQTVKSKGQLMRIGILMRQLIELAKIQAGRNIDLDYDDIETEDSVCDRKTTTLDEIDKTNLPMISALMGPEEFAEKLRHTLTEEEPSRLLALAMIRISIHIDVDNATIATGRARLELLDNVISRLFGSMRDADLLAYMPDGSFALLISPIPTVALASSIFNRTFNAMSQPVVRNGKLYSVSVSAGINLIKSRHGVSHTEILEYIAHSRVLLDKVVKDNVGHWIMDHE
ncbi:hypothetical protein GX645_00455 [Candidatus Sumerlaeota bacterium]|nr:hypothetical protein [Candidatus Sumerlaeales bacterium]NLD60911.1 hypothetical protein [Candidatus Sumerlaeota bacterium]